MFGAKKQDTHTLAEIGEALTCADWPFWSIARGEELPESDIDILVKFKIQSSSWIWQEFIMNSLRSWEKDRPGKRAVIRKRTSKEEYLQRPSDNI